MKLYEIAETYNNITDLLGEETDNEGLLLALDQIDDEFDSKVENIVKLMKSLDGNIIALKEEEKRLASRRKALENKQKGMKEYIENMMLVTNKKKVQTTLFTVAMQKNKASVDIIDEDLIPEGYKEIITTTKIDKKKLYEDLKENEIDGVALKQSESLRIR